MKRLLVRGMLFAVVLLMTCSIELSGAAIAESEKLAYLFNPSSDERVPLFYEPSYSATPFGEYFNGVQVNVLENASPGWMKVQIVTVEGVKGVQAYVHEDYLLYGADGENIEKTTIMYEVKEDDLYLAAAPNGQCTYFGPYAKNEKMELLGFIADTGYDEYIKNGLPLGFNYYTRLHLKAGETTGFLRADDDNLGMLNRIE